MDLFSIDIFWSIFCGFSDGKVTGSASCRHHKYDGLGVNSGVQGGEPKKKENSKMKIAI